jgi:hypothetical protein
MPIKNDLTEAKEANDFLADVVLDKPEMVCGSSGEHTKNLILLLGETLKDSSMKKETQAKFGKFLNNISSNQSLSDSLAETFNQLTDLQKKRFDKATKLAN